MEEATMTNKDAALNYLRKGLSVIPLWSPAMIKKRPPRYFVEQIEKKLEENRTSKEPLPEDEIKRTEIIKQCKVPLIPWKEYQTRLPREEEVCEWFDQNTEANIGIVTGAISRLVVFDLDSDDAVAYAKEKGGFPDTPKVKTGKGYHVYMRHPGFAIRNSVNAKLKIDVRADGGYVAAPPSMHGSGHIYQWEKGCSIHEIDPAPCAPWMIEYLKSIAEGKNRTVDDSKIDLRIPQREQTGSKEVPNDLYTGLLRNGAMDGNRNDSATRLTGHLLAKGLGENEALELLKIWNSTKNKPPLAEDELRKTFQSVSRLESKKEKKEIKAAFFLDTPERALTEYSQSYVRIPFAADGKLKILEKKMNGGLIGGNLYVLGGIPSAGKTGLANNLCDNVCMAGWPVLFFSYDDGVSDLRYRTYARFSGFGIEDFNQNRLQKSDITAIASNENIRRIIVSKYVVPQMINIEDWPSLIDQIKERHKKAPVIFIDYLRKLRTKNQQADERLRVDEILTHLTQIAKKYNTPVMAISELARDSYKSGQRLSMASFKESGSIEYEASWLGILAAVEESDGGFNLKQDWERMIQQDGTVDLIVFKAKRGTGETGKIALKMDKAKMTFRDRIESGKLDTVTAVKKSKFD
jgi:replicative DNA helicase